MYVCINGGDFTLRRLPSKITQNAYPLYVNVTNNNNNNIDNNNDNNNGDNNGDNNNVDSGDINSNIKKNQIDKDLKLNNSNDNNNNANNSTISIPTMKTTTSPNTPVPWSLSKRATSLNSASSHRNTPNCPNIYNSHNIYGGDSNNCNTLPSTGITNDQVLKVSVRVRPFNTNEINTAARRFGLIYLSICLSIYH
jgi:hypothetical protein